MSVTKFAVSTKSFNISFELSPAIPCQAKHYYCGWKYCTINPIHHKIFKGCWPIKANLAHVPDFILRHWEILIPIPNNPNATKDNKFIIADSSGRSIVFEPSKNFISINSPT
jgi:hypothetical protein